MNEKSITTSFEKAHLKRKLAFLPVQHCYCNLGNNTEFSSYVHMIGGTVSDVPNYTLLNQALKLLGLLQHNRVQDPEMLQSVLKPPAAVGLMVTTRLRSASCA